MAMLVPNHSSTDVDSSRGSGLGGVAYDMGSSDPTRTGVVATAMLTPRASSPACDRPGVVGTLEPLSMRDGRRGVAASTRTPREEVSVSSSLGGMAATVGPAATDG